MPAGSAKYVVLGGGMVAGYAAKEFAERDANDVLIVSSDSVPPYERPPLSKGFLAGKDDEASVFINPEQWYREHGIEVRLGDGHRQMVAVPSFAQDQFDIA